MMKWLPAFLVIILFSCSSKSTVPRGILEPKVMQSVFWDYIRADVYSRDFIKKDSSKNDTLENIRLQNRVFNYYKISREDFYRSYKYYSAHPELMRNMIDTMLANQNRGPIKNILKDYE
jgi:hypothetical protein